MIRHHIKVILIDKSPIKALIKILVVNEDVGVGFYLPTTTFSMDAKATS